MLVQHHSIGLGGKAGEAAYVACDKSHSVEPTGKCAKARIGGMRLIAIGSVQRRCAFAEVAVFAQIRQCVEACQCLFKWADGQSQYLRQLGRCRSCLEIAGSDPGRDGNGEGTNRSNAVTPYSGGVGDQPRAIGVGFSEMGLHLRHELVIARSFVDEPRAAFVDNDETRFLAISKMRPCTGFA